MRRSTVLSLPLQLAFPALAYRSSLKVTGSGSFIRFVRILVKKILNEVPENRITDGQQDIKENQGQNRKHFC